MQWLRNLSGSRKFLYAFGLAELGNRCTGGFAVAGFVYEQVLVALCSDLRQVGHGHDLPALTQAPQQLPDDFRRGAADADIDFVEYQGWHP